jgi:pantetheine-phosphate adenylyltransferase
MKRRAVYPGSFDPVTNGHLDIVRRAAGLFGGLVVAVLENPAKDHLFTADERIGFLRAATRRIRNVEVAPFDGLLVDFMRRARADVFVRGLRFVSDFEYEFQMALMNRSLDPGVEAAFLVAAPETTHVSSSLVKEVARLGRDVSRFVPPAVAKALRERSR